MKISIFGLIFSIFFIKIQVLTHFSSKKTKKNQNFSHEWETVAQAAFRKYPNPLNRSITGIDVVKQTLEAGKILTERIIQSHFSIPSWATKVEFLA